MEFMKISERHYALVSSFFYQMMTFLKLYDFIAFECDYFQVRPPFISQLKTIRQLAVTRLTEFFENLNDFDVKPICDGVFSYAVWPQVKSKVFLS